MQVEIENSNTYWEPHQNSGRRLLGKIEIREGEVLAAHVSEMFDPFTTFTNTYEAVLHMLNKEGWSAKNNWGKKASQDVA